MKHKYIVIGATGESAFIPKPQIVTLLELKAIEFGHTYFDSEGFVFTHYFNVVMGRSA
jgi:hypothetical protein